MLGRLGTFWRRLFGWPGQARHEGDGTPFRVERRQGARYASTAEISWGPADAPPAARRPARVRDVSFGGISFLAGEHFEPGALVAVGLPGDDGRHGVALLGCVRHATAQEGKGWALGCSFIRELNERELESFF
jgi:hypothetical protein